MLVGEGAKLDVHGCKTVDMASSFGKVCFQWSAHEIYLYNHRLTMGYLDRPC